jgi:sugar O-acyltransferase (sialic acid O-acetyltransferase NeuD family)
MRRDLIIVGGGGFGREVCDLVAEINQTPPEDQQADTWNLVGVVDDQISDVNAASLVAAGVEHLGGVDDVVGQGERPRYVVGIGSPVARRQIADRLDAAGFQAATLLHPAATVGSSCRIGEGAIVCAGARVTTNVVLGRHVHLNPNATVGHDTVLGDFVSANPQAAVSGDCTVEDGVLLGATSVVLQGLTVGMSATVGAAACVVRDVPPGVVVKGVPAR